MEKTAVLIERLLDQYHNNASNRQLRITAQLLLSELEKQGETEEETAHQVVSVFFPSSSRFSADEVYNETLVMPETKQEEKIIAAPELKPEPAASIKEEEHTYFDPMIEIPTLALKQQEINETIAAHGESLNDKLKSKSSFNEVGTSIKRARYGI